MKTIFKGKNGPFGLILLLIGSMIGAGFITGAETWHFFARFGWGVFASLICFGLLLYFLVTNELRGDVDNCIGLKTGQFWLKKQVNFVGELLIASAMVSGLKDVIFDLDFNGEIFIFLLVIIVIFIVLFIGFKLFSIYNYFVVGFVAVVLAVLIKNLDVNAIKIDNYLNITNVSKACVYAALYVFMNVSALKPILRNSVQKLSCKDKKIVAIIFPILMIFIILTMSIFLINSKDLINDSMPLKLYFCKLGKSYEIIFIVGVIMTMISTAVSCAIGVKEKFSARLGGGVSASICSIILILIFGNIPFEIFVSKFYPMIGFLNFVIFIFDIL